MNDGRYPPALVSVIYFIIDQLNAEVHKVMKQPNTVTAMRDMAVDIALGTPEEFGKLIESEMVRWGKVVRALNLKAE